MATLVLLAGTSSALTIVCQRAGKGAPRLVGGVSPSFQGALRSTVRGQAKVIPILASYVDTATEASIQAAAMNGAQIPCSGDILQNIQTVCSVDQVVSNMIPGLPGFFEMSFTLNEVNASTILLKYAAGDTITGEAFTRSTTGTYYTSAGLVASAAINAKRDSHYPTIGAARSLLLEAARTNLLLRSEAFDNASWVKTNVTVTADLATSPDGTNTADKVAATASAAANLTQAVVIAGTAATFTCFVKKGSGATDCNRFGVRNTTTATDLVFITINLDTGAIAYTSVTTSGASVDVLGNGWYRIKITPPSGISNGDTLTASVGFVGAAETAGEFSYVWGAQIEAGAFASSYIPTVAATVPRGADSYSLPFTPAPQEMSAYAKFVESGTFLISSARVAAITSVGSATPYFLLYNSGPAYTTLHDNGTANVLSILGAAPVIGNTVELDGRLFGDGSVDATQSINSAASTASAQSAANALATAWAASLVWLNSGGSSNAGFIALQSFKIVAGARSLSELRAA